MHAVLVTGASGFVAVWCCHTLLENGYSVTGTVRSHPKGQYLQHLFSKHGDRFKYVIVDDIESEGAFDDAAKHVDAVLHTASPFHFKADDPYQDLINPAVNGTKSMLQSAAAHGSNIRRIVITSSFAAIVEPTATEKRSYSEKDWNQGSPAALEKDGKNVDQKHAYRASKTLAERAAWEFVENQKPSFDIVTVNPPLVLGPIIHQVNKPESLNTSIAQWYQYLSGQSTSVSDNFAGFAVDVRDLANAHMRALQVPKAGGNRFVISKESFTWQTALNMFHSSDAANQTKDVFTQVPKAVESHYDPSKEDQLDATKSKQVLGLDYHSMQDTIRDMSISLAERERKQWA